jgi:thiamine-phosphate pyrophosphorylase
MKNSNGLKKKIIRLIDANLNRTKEALRVCEEISRFIIEDPILSVSYKNLRHKITRVSSVLGLDLKALLNSRDTEADVGKKSIVSETKRKNIRDIFFANMQRLKESIRVLEEFSKIINRKASQNFKTIRFQIYALEKKTSKILLSLYNS